MTTMKKTGHTLHARGSALRSAVAALGLSVGAVMGAAAQQVNDLPGGPAVNGLNFQPAASQMAESLHGLHWIMLALCAVIFVLVFGVMFYSIFKHRKAAGYQAQEQNRTQEMTHSQKTGRVWAVGKKRIITYSCSHSGDPH